MSGPSLQQKRQPPEKPDDQGPDEKRPRSKPNGLPFDIQSRPRPLRFALHQDGGHPGYNAHFIAHAEHAWRIDEEVIWKTWASFANRQTAENWASRFEEHFELYEFRVRERSDTV